MSLVELRVELPAYSHTFSIQLPSTCTILDVKREIELKCQGSPRPNGQRLIWRGRLLSDEAKVQDVWQSSDEPRIIHLAVHPSAWSSEPPTLPQSVPQPASTTAAMHAGHEPATDVPSALHYILTKHNNAILALLRLEYLPPTAIDSSTSKRVAEQMLNINGYEWPSILDEEFPPQSNGGLVYERVTSDNQRYLILKNPTATPTALQLHCLKLLTFTFPLLTLPMQHTSPLAPQVESSLTTQIPPHVNQVLAQLGLPQIRLAQNANANPVPIPAQNAVHIPAANPVANPAGENNRGNVAFRPLFMIAPTLLLLFRTALLLYFFAPARKPLFGILLVAVVIYEGWQPIRNAFMRGRQAGAAAVQQQAPPANQNQNPPPDLPMNPQAIPPVPAQRPQPNLPANLGQPPADTIISLLELFATINLPLEELMIAPVPTESPAILEPGWIYKFTAFVSLLTVSVHPAIWDRRRALLAMREGKIRTEAAIRNALPEEDMSEARSNARNELSRQHASKPVWVKKYIERVLANEWLDEVD